MKFDEAINELLECTRDSIWIQSDLIKNLETLNEDFKDKINELEDLLEHPDYDDNCTYCEAVRIERAGRACPTHSKDRRRKPKYFYGSGKNKTTIL